MVVVVTVEGKPHPLVCAALVCYDAKGCRVNSIFSFDTDTLQAVKLNGAVVPVLDFGWEVASGRDADRLRFELEERWHQRIKVTSSGVCFAHNY
jgi:hypothetical protein